MRGKSRETEWEKRGGKGMKYMGGILVGDERGERRRDDGGYKERKEWEGDGK
jgi:hypothetical protein